MKLAGSRLALYATVSVTKFVGRYSARLAGPAASVLWFTPWRVPVSDRGLRKQAGWLEQTQRFALRTTVGRVSGFVAGEGPLVVLVHGWGERAAGLGGFIAPLTNAGFTVVGFDLPAHGDSSGQTSHPIEAAAALREVVGHLGGAHAIVAHSAGCNAALVAMKDGLAANRAVFIAPNVDIRYTLDTFQLMFGLPPKAMAGLRRQIERRFGPGIWREVDGEFLAAHLTTPGLVFHDPEDPQVRFEGARKLVGSWAGSKLIEAPGLGHGAITRAPDVIERAVAFVAHAALGATRAVPGSDSRSSRASDGAITK